MVVTSLIGAIDNRILKLVTIAILFVNIVSKIVYLSVKVSNAQYFFS